MNCKRAIRYCFTLALFFIACESDKSTDQDTEASRRIVILYTNDEHGWMEGSDGTNGAAELMGLWREEEDYSEEGPYLILSGGDNWTGPAISTWFKGESMVAVMNAMVYDVAAIGNHEFDFKIDELYNLIDEAEFPYLSANIREKATGDMADFALPYIIREVNGVFVGIIGLTTTTTPWSTFPDNVVDYDFIAYETALEEVVPQVRKDGAELLIVIGHICLSEMQSLIPIATDLGIALIGGGHCNELITEVVNGIVIIEGGSHLRSYAKADIYFDILADTLMSITTSTHENVSGTPDPVVENVVSYWREQADAELSEVIGYVEETIGQYSNAMHNMVTDSWLFSYPEADISMTNSGGIRQSIAAGEITKGAIIGVLPFDNNILELELTGSQIEDCIGYLIVGGMTTIDGFKLSDGSPIEPNTAYRVLTTDYLYLQPNINFSIYDPNPYYTSMNYHQPTIDWIKSLNTSPSNPLDNYLDHNPRR